MNKSTPSLRPQELSVSSNAKPFPIVGIGASAGGLEAFTELLKHLPLDTGMGFVLVQHLDPAHRSSLTELLAQTTKLPVREAMHNFRVEPNHIYVIPPNTSLSIANGVLKLEPRRKGAQRVIDFFFEALAHDQKDCAIGVVLSGTATDGTLGLEAIKGEGGITFAQDESAKYDSMPRSAVAAGCVDFVLSPETIAQELARIARHPLVAGAHFRVEQATGLSSGATRPAEGEGRTKKQNVFGRKHAPAIPAGEPPTGTGGSPVPPTEGGYRKILLLLRNHSGVDFSLYKFATIERRIRRRMVLNRQGSLEDYAKFLRGNQIWRRRRSLEHQLRTSRGTERLQRHSILSVAGSEGTKIAAGSALHRIPGNPPGVRSH